MADEGTGIPQQGTSCCRRHHVAGPPQCCCRLSTLSRRRTSQVHTSAYRQRMHTVRENGLNIVVGDHMGSHDVWQSWRSAGTTCFDDWAFFGGALDGFLPNRTGIARATRTITQDSQPSTHADLSQPVHNHGARGHPTPVLAIHQRCSRSARSCRGTAFLCVSTNCQHAQAAAGGHFSPKVCIVDAT